MRRPFILGVGIVGVLLLLAALGLNLMLHRRDQASAPEPAIAAAPPVAPVIPFAPSGLARAGAPQPPSFDIVRISPSGDVVIAGRAEPQAEVHVLDGEREIGTVTADARGQWVLLPSEPLASGDRALSLRAQRPGEAAVDSEKVVIEVTPRPAGVSPTGAAAGGRADSGAVVAPGNSLWELARNRYGDGAQYQTIYQANRGQIRNPDLIYPGQVFVMPEAPRPGR